MAILDWLLDSDPAIRWQVLRDLVHAPENVYLTERERIAQEGWGARLLDLQGEDGQWAGGACFPGPPLRLPEDEAEGVQPWISTLPTLQLLHGFGVECAEALAEFWHKRIRTELGFSSEDDANIRKLFQQQYRGSRYSFGYPACPNLEDRAILVELLKPHEIGVTLSENYMLVPEQSTDAIVAHHPQAVYFGMKSGFIPEEKVGDELIAGTEQGGELPPEQEPGGDAAAEEAGTPA